MFSFRLLDVLFLLLYVSYRGKIKKRLKQIVISKNEKRTLAHENDWYYNNYIMRLLIVEDENDLRNIVKKRLVKEHYSVDACGDGLEAMDYIDMTSYDGIILDIMLPGKDGYEILRELRQREDDTPVLLLTAKDSIEDRVKGLDLGADDYLIKPFAFEELLARIRVMMRRKPQFTSNQLKIADLILDRDTRKVTRAGNEIDLSAKEQAGWLERVFALWWSSACCSTKDRRRKSDCSMIVVCCAGRLSAGVTVSAKCMR